MSLFELVCVIGIACVLAALALSAMARSHATLWRTRCVSSLKYISLAYRIFETDNNDLFPFQIPIKDGGSLELSNNIVAQFQILSNELSTPKMLICPTRTIQQTAATNWATLQRSNISYYLSLTASASQTNSILTGDAGFTVNGALSANRIVVLSATDKIVYPNRFHGKADVANLCRVDGSVQEFGSKAFPAMLKSTPYATNLLVMP